MIRSKLRCNPFLLRWVARALSSLVVAGAGAAQAGILVVAPHPDDDVITSSGVIARALADGEDVRVVFMTNGDVDGTASGLLRQGEAVAAQAELGVPEDHLIFLGYPDTDVSGLYYDYPRATDVLDHLGQRRTYGNRGIGFADWHTYRFGSPATYNGHNALADLADVLWTYRPDHVFVTSELDGHADHRATFLFVRDAIDAVRGSDPAFDPVIHRTVVWSTESWPNAPSPLTYFAEVPTLQGTSMPWNQRESLDVPLSMQSIDLQQNPKYRAIARHESQGGNGSYIGRFLHKDEIFWPVQASGNHPPVPNAGLDQEAPRNAVVTLDGSRSFDLDGEPLTFQWRQVAGPPVSLSNPASATPTFVVPGNLLRRETATFALVVSDGHASSVPDSVTIGLGSDILPPQNVALVATATASSQNTSTQQLASKAIDGIADGAPRDHTREWATIGGRAGEWIQLTWPDPHVVDRVVLVDRPNPDDWITAGRLTFSDGSTIGVGALANDGSWTSVSFAPRRITWVRFDVTAVAANTINVGLAEFMVFSPSVLPENSPPVAVTGPDRQAESGAVVTLHGEDSYDIDDDPLAFHWTQIAGPIVSLSEPAAATPTFVAPAVSGATLLEFQLVVEDGSLSSEPAVARVTIEPPAPPPLRNLALSATATASSESPQQEAFKAIDGHREGHPVNGTREWSSSHEGAGAWIQLAWPTAQLSHRIVLYDRPNLDDQIIAATLTFSDGFEIAVGPLDNAGGPTAISFSPRFFWWVRLTVTQTSASTSNVGLAEFEVIEVLDPGDLPPVAVVGGPQAVYGGDLVELDGDASYDPEGAPLVFAWTQVLGPAVTLSSDSAAAPTFVAPAVTARTELAFELVVGDGSWWSDPVSAAVTILPASQGMNLALAAMATASSQNAGTGQLAQSAIDGVIEGYSNGGHWHEWATVGQGAGAWIRLDWSSPRTVGEVVLYDRPNLDDHVRSGTLEFSDGSSVAVGALDNAGGGIALRFTQRTVTWLRFVVGEVGGATSNVGLSEIEVFE